MCKEGAQANIRPGLAWEPRSVTAEGPSRTEIQDGSSPLILYKTPLGPKGSQTTARILSSQGHQNSQQTTEIYQGLYGCMSEEGITGRLCWLGVGEWQGMPGRRVVSPKARNSTTCSGSPVLFCVVETSWTEEMVLQPSLYVIVSCLRVNPLRAGTICWSVQNLLGRLCACCQRGELEAFVEIGKSHV